MYSCTRSNNEQLHDYTVKASKNHWQIDEFKKLILITISPDCGNLLIE